MLNKKVGLIALLVSFAVGEVFAGTLVSYSVDDVLVCFRKTAGGGNDLVVDAGPIATLTNAAPNASISITQYNGGQLALVGTNNISWSAFTWFDGSINPNWTLFATKARSSLNTQTSPWQVGNSGQQQLCAVGDMSTIPPGAASNRSFKTQNTDSAVVEPDSTSSYVDGQSYSFALGPNSDFNGDFPGGASVENSTLGNFTTAGKVVRSDFYRMTPTSGFGLGTFLGYFELSTNGAMSYVAYPTAVPVIKSISRAGTTATISYTTGIYGTYTLLGTNNLAAPVSTWPAVSTLTKGDNLTHNVMDTDSGGVKFYIISAQ